MYEIFFLPLYLSILLQVYFRLVLHPGVRMSWVREYWDPEWSKDAEKKIKELVGIILHRKVLHRQVQLMLFSF